MAARVSPAPPLAKPVSLCPLWNRTGAGNEISCMLCVQIIYVKLSVVMGLGWVLGFVAAFSDWSVLWYAFIVINSLQGAMLCAAFVVTRQVKRLLADCIRPLRRRAASRASNDLSQSLKTPSAVETPGPGNSTAVMRLSLPEID